MGEPAAGVPVRSIRRLSSWWPETVEEPQSHRLVNVRPGVVYSTIRLRTASADGGAGFEPKAHNRIAGPGYAESYPPISPAQPCRPTTHTGRSGGPRF